MHKNKQSSLVVVVFSRLKLLVLLLCVHFCQCLQHPRKLELDCSVSKPEVHLPPRACSLPRIATPLQIIKATKSEAQ